MFRGVRGRVTSRVFLTTQWVRGRLNKGYCPICECDVWFNEMRPWLRVSRCGSVPRNRAILKVLNDHFPGWRELRMHESSPGDASSDKIKRECKCYVASQFFPGVPKGQFKDGQRSEDQGALTFSGESFDLVITPSGLPG